jgi:hypothetical protein
MLPTGLPAGYADDDVIGGHEDNAPPLPFLPGNFLRGAVSEQQPRPSLNLIKLFFCFLSQTLASVCAPNISMAPRHSA